MPMRCGPYSIAICDDGRHRAKGFLLFKMRTVESVAGDDDVSARAFCRLAEWLSCSTLDNLSNPGVEVELSYRWRRKNSTHVCRFLF